MNHCADQADCIEDNKVQFSKFVKVSGDTAKL